MKKLLLTLFFITALSQAQIVNIPDANFKAKLVTSNTSNYIVRDLNDLPIALDANADGEIQVSEAENVSRLSLGSSGISSLEGVQAFTNLAYLDCPVNNLNLLNVSGLTNLTYLTADNNTLMTALNVSGCTSLYVLSAQNSGLISLDVSALVNLHNISVNNNQLASLNLSGCIGLDDIRIDHNQLTTLDASGLGNITRLGASYNALTSIDLTGTNVALEIGLGHNQLTTLDISNSSADLIEVTYNNLSSIVLHPNGNYYSPRLQYNQLETLDLTGIKLEGMTDFSNNNLTSINFEGSELSGTISLRYNNLQSIDLTNVLPSSFSVYLELAYNPNLQSIFAKNGNEEDFTFTNGTNLAFVCADEFELQDIQGLFNIYQIPNAVVSPYCFFQPGGNYNTISGTITFDADDNGCDSTDPDQPYVKLNLTSGNNNYAVFTSPDGTYNNFGQTGTFNVSVAMENASLFTITPPLATIIFGNNNNNITTQDFCITANGIQNDLETVIVPLLPARPGFDATYKIIYKNKGNQMLSGSVDFNYQDNELDFVNASVIPDTQYSGSLSWNFNNLYPFESRSLTVVLNVNSPQETPAVNIGDQLNFSVQANPIAGDVTPGDNGFSIKQVVIGSYDPNDITCLEGEHVNPTEIGKYLHYNINFENTGTAAAENIVVKDMIDLTKYDISSLQILNASHPVTTRITNGKVEFIFEGINLGASEHGNVTFKIKTKNTLITGNSVSQKADIYFDYNFPVATNVAMTTFDALGTDPVLDNGISFYPNPVNDMLNVNSDEIVRKIELYDLRGRLLQTVAESNSINLTRIPPGIYLIQAFTDAGFKAEKVIKR